MLTRSFQTLSGTIHFLLIWCLFSFTLVTLKSVFGSAAIILTALLFISAYAT